MEEYARLIVESGRSSKNEVIEAGLPPEWVEDSYTLSDFE